MRRRARRAAHLLRIDSCQLGRDVEVEGEPQLCHFGTKRFEGGSLQLRAGSRDDRSAATATPSERLTHLRAPGTDDCDRQGPRPVGAWESACFLTGATSNLVSSVLAPAYRTTSRTAASLIATLAASTLSPPPPSPPPPPPPPSPPSPSPPPQSPPPSPPPPPPSRPPPSPPPSSTAPPPRATRV